MNLARASLGLVFVVAACASPPSPEPIQKFGPRPAAVTPCEQAYAAMAYDWEGRVADWTPAPSSVDPFEPDELTLAAFRACTFDELTAASRKFLIHEYGDPEDALVRYWTPSEFRLRVDDCAYEIAKDTKLCQEVNGP